MNKLFLSPHNFLYSNDNNLLVNKLWLESFDV